MSQIRVTGIWERKKELDDLSNDFYDIEEEMIKAGAEVLEEAWRDAIKAYNYIDTGDMLESVGSDIRHKNGRTYAVVMPMGYDSKGTPNALKAYCLHYGTSEKQGSRFVDRIRKGAELRVIKKMNEVFDEELQRRGLGPTKKFTGYEGGGIR